MRYLALVFSLLLSLPASAQQVSQPAPATSVPSNAVLTASSTTAFPNGVWRFDYAAGAGAPPLFYAPGAAACSLNAGAGDNGSQVRSANGKCWIAHFTDRGRVDVRQFGAKPDNLTDTAPFVLAAYNADLGVYLPGSVGVWRFASNQTYTGHRLMVTGDYPTEFQGPSACPTGTPAGTWIHIPDLGAGAQISPFNITEAAAAGSQVANLGICQDHPAPGPGWAPKVYPPVFNLSSVQGCFIHNIYYYGIYDGTKANNSARCTHSDIRGQVFHNTWTGDHLLDITTLSNFHLYPFWNSGSEVLAWQQANGDVLMPYRVDTLNLDNFFANNYRSCLRMQASPAGYGVPSGISGNIYCDTSHYGIWVQNDNTYGNQLDLYMSGGDAGSEGLRIEGTANQLSFANLFCYFTNASCVDDRSLLGNNFINIANAFAFGYDVDNASNAAFRLGAAQSDPSRLNFGSQPFGIYSGGAPIFDDGGVSFIAVGGWYNKSWGPTLTFNGSANGVTGTFAGAYTRNLFTNETYGNYSITLTNKGSSTGQAIITGMPYTANYQGTGTVGTYYNMTGVGSMTGFLASGPTFGIQLVTGGATGSAGVTNANFTNTSVINGTFQFQ